MIFLLTILYFNIYAIYVTINIMLKFIIKYNFTILLNKLFLVFYIVCHVSCMLQYLNNI